MNKMHIIVCLFALSAGYVILAGGASPKSQKQTSPSTSTTSPMPEKKEDQKDEIAVFGSGCFWCVEAVFESLDGVHDVESGYMGGHIKDPTYRAVCTGRTGHAEVVRIHFDPEVISFDTLLDWFWRSHDPTTLNRQGADVGTQYRSVVYYQSETQKVTAEAAKKLAQQYFKDPIVTEISPTAIFYPAEEDHQDYYQANRAAPYCQFVIRPKLKKLALE
ncbi:MAG: peptide-methionine (S)-S-oxide reductase MsrA [Coraliomargaritaceae bacterium]